MFGSFFRKPLQTNVLFQSPLSLCLLSSACHFFFFKPYIFPKHNKYVIVPDISYGTWNFPSVTFLANKYGYTITRSGK